jgi:hypothetical protein
VTILQRVPKGKRSLKKKRRVCFNKSLNEYYKSSDRRRKQAKSDKGYSSEARASEALNNLQKKLEDWVYFTHKATERNSKGDNKGIDHVITFLSPESEILKFQIKSSEGGAQDHKVKYHDIPVVVMRANKFENMKEILEKLFKDYIIRNQDEALYRHILATLINNN